MALTNILIRERRLAVRGMELDNFVHTGMGEVRLPRRFFLVTSASGKPYLHPPYTHAVNSDETLQDGGFSMVSFGGGASLAGDRMQIPLGLKCPITASVRIPSLRTPLILP